MRIKLDIDASHTDCEVIIKAPALTPEISQIISLCNSESNLEIPGYLDDSITLLSPADIDRIFAQRGKVFAEVTNKHYELKSPLYTFEEKLETHYFVRISKSEIINLRKVSHFEPDVFNGFAIIMKNGIKTYASRRYVSHLKERIGV